MSAKIIFDEQVTFVTDPVSPCAGQDFTVSWQEKNIGGEDSSEYQDIFDLDDQGSGDSKELRCDPLPVGKTLEKLLKVYAVTHLRMILTPTLMGYEELTAVMESIG